MARVASVVGLLTRVRPESPCAPKHQGLHRLRGTIRYPKAA
jgi:hypothetical protein